MSNSLPSSSRPGPRRPTRPVATQSSVPPSGWLQRHKWTGRLCLAALGPAIFLALVEGILRLAGYGYPVSFFIRSESGDSYTTNQKFAWQFFGPDTALKPFLCQVPITKERGSLRICILGESAAMGTPDPAFSFARILEAGLRRNFPRQKFEVINAAMRGINSHVIRKIARECAEHEVDVFIIYMGNNEMIGLHSPGPDTPAWGESLVLIRVADWARATKLGQLLGAVAAGIHRKNSPVQDMTYFRRQALPAADPRRQVVYAHFQANLEEICRSATRFGTKTILSTVPVNLRDFPPLQSLPSRPQKEADLQAWQRDYQQACELQTAGQLRSALERFLRLDALGHSHAELCFRLGQCSIGLGEYAQARGYLEKARDLDALQFRADTRVNQIIRGIASDHGSHGVTLVDSERLMGQNDPQENGVPGARMFHDHVHPTFAGNYLLARSIYERLVQLLDPGLVIAKNSSFPPETECARAIAYTEYDQLEVTAAFNKLSAKPPFLNQLDHARRQAQAEAEYARRAATFSREKAEVCLQTYQAAIKADPEFWPLRFNLAALYDAVGQPGAAAGQYQSVVDQFPQVKRFRISLANALAASGDQRGATTQLRAALRIDPKDRVLREQLRKLE